MNEFRIVYQIEKFTTAKGWIVVKTYYTEEQANFSLSFSDGGRVIEALERISNG